MLWLDVFELRFGGGWKEGRRRAGSGQGLGRRNGCLCVGFDLYVNRRNWAEVAHQGWLGLEERMAFFVPYLGGEDLRSGGRCGVSGGC